MGMLREYVRMQSMLRKGKCLEDWRVRGMHVAIKAKRGVSQTSTPVSRYSAKQVGPTADNSSDEGCCFIVPRDGIPRLKSRSPSAAAITVLCTWG